MAGIENRSSTHIPFARDIAHYPQNIDRGRLVRAERQNGKINRDKSFFKLRQNSMLAELVSDYITATPADQDTKAKVVVDFTHGMPQPNTGSVYVNSLYESASDQNRKQLYGDLLARVRPQTEHIHELGKDAQEKVIIVTRVERQAPTDPEDIFANFLSACHLELGVMILEALPRIEPGFTAKELVKEIFGESNKVMRKYRSNMNPQRITGYLESIFVDVALVAKESHMDIATGEPITFYSLTTLGQQLQGIGYYLIRSLDEINKRNSGGEGRSNVSLAHILTKQASSAPNVDYIEKPQGKDRAPYNRAKIIGVLGGLPESESITIASLAESAQLPGNTTSTHLKSLQSAGIVSYISAHPEKKGEFPYSVTSGIELPENYNFGLRWYELVNRAYGYIRKTLQASPNATISGSQITNVLFDQLTEERTAEGKSAIQRKSIESYVASLLSVLAKDGLLHREYDPHKEHSHVQLTPLGYEISQILQDVKQACIDPEIAQHYNQLRMREYQTFLRQKRADLLDQQRAAGRKSAQRPEERLGSIISLLIDHPEGIRPSVINENLGLQVGGYLNELIINGIIEKSQPGTGRARLYQLSSEARAILSRNPDIAYEDLLAQLKNEEEEKQ